MGGLGRVRRFVDLDSGHLIAGAGAFGMGEVENRRGRAAAGGILRGRRFWRGDQRRARGALGQAHQSDVSVRNGLEPALPNAGDVRNFRSVGMAHAGADLRGLPRAAQPQATRVRGREMSGHEREIVFENVSKFYGEVLGVNRVNLTIPPGITSLVGPNGSGKTTLMNLMTGLLRPTQGRISVLGVPPDEPERLFRFVGYCTQFDSFPRGMTGYQFVYSYLRLHGKTGEEAAD